MQATGLPPLFKLPGVGTSGRNVFCLYINFNGADTFTQQCKTKRTDSEIPVNPQCPYLPGKDTITVGPRRILC